MPMQCSDFRVVEEQDSVLLRKMDDRLIFGFLGIYFGRLHLIFQT